VNTILVTGATGLLGLSLIPYLKSCDYNVITHARSSQADFMFDLSDGVQTHKMLEQIQPSMIVNLASLTSVEECEENINIAFLINTRSVESLTDWILESGANCHLIQISTDHIYDGDGVNPNTEDKVTITNNYAFSKYAGELVATQVPSTILRTNFVGRSQLKHRESLTDWVYRSITSGIQVNILNDVYFSPLSIQILCQMIELVLQKKPIGTFNLGSHNGMSKANFDIAFAEALKLPTNTMKRIELSQATFFKAKRPKDMLMDSSKFENALNVKLPDLIDIIVQVSKEYDEISHPNT